MITEKDIALKIDKEWGKWIDDGEIPLKATKSLNEVADEVMHGYGLLSRSENKKQQYNFTVRFTRRRTGFIVDPGFYVAGNQSAASRYFFLIPEVDLYSHINSLLRKLDTSIETLFPPVFYYVEALESIRQRAKDFADQEIVSLVEDYKLTPKVQTEERERALDAAIENIASAITECVLEYVSIDEP